MTYNGWKNYETWATYSWLSNDEFTYREVSLIAEKGSTPKAAKILREYVEDMFWGTEAPAALSTDLLLASLDEVDWEKIVEALND